LEIIDLYLKSVLGDFDKKQFPLNQGNTNKVCYIKPLFSYPTIELVIISPYVFQVYLNDYVLNKENLFYVLLYDKETDLIVGSIEEVYFGETWESELKYSILTCEDKLEKSQCPKCTFWLIQKINKYGHHFLSCSDYPECNYSCEIEDL
jgi:hypothetical protein